MKRGAVALAFILTTFSVWAVTSPKVGTIDYVEGGVTINRVGKIIADPNIDDPLFSGDLIKTAGDGVLIVAMDKTTGMNGTITIKSKSALYLKLTLIKGQPKTSVDLLAGSIGSKVAKISGTPSVSVTMNGAIMGVRGTEYEAAISVNESILVICSEGQVVVNDGKEELPVPAGKALEKRLGERLTYLPVAVSSIKDFRERWILDEVDAFEADAPRALAGYAKRYNDLSAKFQAAYEPFQASATVRKWFDEDRAGARINPLDPGLLREKKEVAGYLLDIRRSLFLFERIYYRVEELSDIISGTPYERLDLGGGLSAGDFLRRVLDERDPLSRQVARFRYAEKLYEARNPDGDLFGSGDEDFFGSNDGF